MHPSLQGLITHTVKTKQGTENKHGLFSFCSSSWPVCIVSRLQGFICHWKARYISCLLLTSTLCSLNVHVSMHRSMTVNDDQQDATIQVYLFIPGQLYMFRAMFSPIIRSAWLYLQSLVLSTDVAAGWCHGWDGTASSISSMRPAGSNIGGHYQKL